MKAVFDHRRTVFIHDFDGVYYRYEDKADFYDFLCDCGAMAGTSLLPSLEHQHAKIIHRDSFVEHGMAHFGYLEYIAEHGFTDHEFTMAYYREYHRHKYERSRNECPEWLVPSDSVQHGFAMLNGIVRHGLLTQSCLHNWAGPKMKEIGIYDYFDPNCLFGFEESNFERKSHSTAPLAMAMEAMNAQPWQTVFIEDSPKNLLKAKELHPDICTVFVCHDKPLDTMPDYIDIQVDSLDRFIQAAVRFHSTPAFAPTPGL